ncbi:MAG: 50S ribosomal protein L25 [SAR202 cluster bacterium]|mgnify:CR=1 FL=1|jgi:large subunit ribosomal protein L25|nr:50S ribosomal protein L25 [SAR202 cluster bacterium]MDP7103754.1 50S ribosomal protein L25 [SAR202 cluster bacterium]MDP7412625.1 50S ribosomal protein L25 [SAR202 cluster bacterium]MDP7533187.1 50S ribosomal protein L25 [SAR202 cluster bacterium]HJO83566.1 50S ribosomal protein L25 [SAR202 cluster bacterium]|tara:strand:+ start:7611 stop:8276 length:666 start_codon:yes stop_codon:yes gene_type:complete
MDVNSVKLDSRTVVGKKVRALRREGLVPVHVYGSGIEPTALQVEDRTLNRLLQSVGANIPVSVEAEGLEAENICFVREVQRHPVTEAILHVDFLRVDVSQTVVAEVPVVLDGAAPGVVLLGGVLLQNLLSLRIEAMPMEMPAAIHLDITGLDDFEKTIQVRGVSVGSDVAVLNDPDDMVVRVTAPRVEEVTEVEEEEGIEGEEGEEDAEGEGGAREGEAEA